MISLLQRTTANYESFSFDELTEKLKGRGLTNAAGCSRQVKIDRLKLNDQVDRDTANGKETQLYAMLSVCDEFGIAHITEELEEAKATNKFSSWSIKRLHHRLDVLKLSANCTQEVLARRVARYYEKENTKKLADFIKNRDDTKAELEVLTGHPVSSSFTFSEERLADNQDHQIQDKARSKKHPKTPICDYDWKDSHWAERTQREISEICLRREMPGRGAAPKAAQLKWLDTGSVEYADFYISGLEIMCTERGIYEAKKEYYIALLEKDNEREEAH